MKISAGSTFSGMTGRLGDYIICQTKDGAILKKRPTFSKSKWANHPSYDRVRKNTSEFGTAGKAVKLIRSAFASQICFAKDTKLTSRMQAVMMKVIKSDEHNGPGFRSAAYGDLSFLNNFNCNIDAPLERILLANCLVNLNWASGIVAVSVPAINPKKQLKHPDRATHFRLIFASSEIDFEENVFDTKASNSDLLPINNRSTYPIELNTPLRAGSGLPVFVAVGIEFVEMINGKEFPFESRGFNPLCFVKIEKL